MGLGLGWFLSECWYFKNVLWDVWLEYVDWILCWKWLDNMVGVWILLFWIVKVEYLFVGWMLILSRMGRVEKFFFLYED